MVLTLRGVARCCISSSRAATATAMLRCAAVSAVAREWIGAVRVDRSASVESITSRSSTDSLLRRCKTARRSPTNAARRDCGSADAMMMVRRRSPSRGELMLAHNLIN